MAKDEGKNLGYHWRRSLGIYDAPDHKGPPGNANTTTGTVSGLAASQTDTSKSTGKK